MPHDDLSSWLKVVADNKLNSKNTWKSTLIDHFSDIKQFKEMQGINFQKASCTLDGCVKVYSTRVDDISEEALKLLEGFSLEDTKKKVSKRKDTKTLEKNLSNINIKTNTNPFFRDPLFTTLSKRPSLFLSTLNISTDGIFRLCLCESPRDLIYCNQEIQIYETENKKISPNLDNHINNDNKVDLYNDDIDNKVDSNINLDINKVDLNINLDIDKVDLNINLNTNLNTNLHTNLDDNFMNDNCLDDFVFDGSIGEDCELIQSKTPVYKETAFSYFKGWGGPSQWKLRSGKVQSQAPTKVKEKFFIDFFEDLDYSKIREVGTNTLFDQNEIQKRKEKIHNLPEDFNLEIDDLYKFNLLEKKIFTNDINNGNNINNDHSLLLDNTPTQPIEEPIDETFIDLQKENVKLPYKPEQKKIDMKKLKENILSTIKENIRLTEIYKKVPKMYNKKEGSNISIHFCVVSLLHLAHENNFELEEVGNDIVVRGV